MINRIIKKFFIFVIIILSVLLTCNTSYASNLKVGEYSKKYQEWIKLSDEEKEKTISPLPFNVRDNYSETENKNIKSIAKSNNIPQSFDLREHIDIEVKNQEHTGSCWGFSTCTSLETNLALQNETYNFSERHFEYDTADNYIDLKNPYGLNRTIGSGAFINTAFAYIARGSGPILEEDMPFQNDENPINYYELPKNQAIKKVRDMIYFSNIYKAKDENGQIIYKDSNYESYSLNEVNEIRKSLKEHIMKNGSISALVEAPYDSEGDDIYNISNSSYNNCNYDSLTNHAVSIIGWDDNYDKNNFINVPSENGAYIVLNSWGEDFGDNGVYYVSYEDALIESQLSGESNINNINYDELYQHDYGEMWNSMKFNYAANVYTAEYNSKLTEIMIGSTGSGMCNIYVNNNGDDLNINSLIKVASNELIHPGYTSIPLDTTLDLTQGKKFAIVIESTKGALEFGIDGDAYFSYSNTISNLGESFYSSDGVEWTDIYNENYMTNLCIKAYTQNTEENLKIGKIDGIGFDKIGGEFAFPVYSSYLESGNDVDVLIFKDEQNVTDKFIISGTKIRGNGTYIKLNCDSNIEKGKYFVKVKLNERMSNVEEFDVQEITEDVKVIKFKDKNFFENIKIKLICYSDDKNMFIVTTQDNIDKVTELNFFNDKEITDITGIEYFKNLKILDLNDNKINDLSFLRNLTNLENLAIRELSGGDVIDISPIFQLTNLKSLELSAIDWLTEKELQEMYKLNNLEKLNLAGNKIKNIEFLRTLKLKSLNIGNNAEVEIFDGNEINDFSPISNMTSLVDLDLSSMYKIEDLNFVSNLKNLENLNVSWSNLRDATALDKNDFKDNVLTALYLEGNEIYDGLIINDNKNIVVEVPAIIQQAMNPDSLLYSVDGVSLTGCEWEEFGKTVKIDSGEYLDFEVSINSGCAEFTTWHVELDNTIKINIKDSSQMIKKAINISGREFLIVNSKTKKEDILKDLDTNSEDIKPIIKDNSLIARTNQVISIENSNLLINMVVVVKGDVDSDGEVSFRDILKLNNYRLNKELNQKNWKTSEKIAFNSVKNDGLINAELKKINFRDVLTLNNYRLRLKQ